MQKHLSLLPITMRSPARLISESKECTFQINGRNYGNYSPDNFQIKLMQLSNQLNLMYETQSVDTQVQILTDNFLLALD